VAFVAMKDQPEAATFAACKHEPAQRAGRSEYLTMSKKKIGGSTHKPNPKQSDVAEKAFAMKQFNKPSGGQPTKSGK